MSPVIQRGEVMSWLFSFFYLHFPLLIFSTKLIFDIRKKATKWKHEKPKKVIRPRMTFCAFQIHTANYFRDKKLKRHKDYLLLQIHYFPLSCQDGRQHKNKHEKYLFSMFLCSVSGFLVQHSLKQTTVEKCLPCGFTLSPSCNWRSNERSP